MTTAKIHRLIKGRCNLDNFQMDDHIWIIDKTRPHEVIHISCYLPRRINRIHIKGCGIEKIVFRAGISDTNQFMEGHC